jgi:hypothetical protein
MSEPRGELLIVFKLEHWTFPHWQRNKGICAMPGQHHGKCRCSANQMPWTHGHGTCLQCVHTYLHLNYPLLKLGPREHYRAIPMLWCFLPAHLYQLLPIFHPNYWIPARLVQIHYSMMPQHLVNLCKIYSCGQTKSANSL